MVLCGLMKAIIIGADRGISVMKIIEEYIFLLLFGVAPMFLVPKTNG